MCRKLLSFEQSLQRSCILYLGPAFLPPSNNPGSVLRLTTHNMKEGKLVMCVGRLLASRTSYLHHKHLSLTIMCFQGKVNYTEIKRPCVDLGYFQDAILKYKMLVRALPGALWGVEMSQSLAGGRKPIVHLFTNVWYLCIYELVQKCITCD